MELIIWNVINYTVSLFETIILFKFMTSILTKRLSNLWHVLLMVLVSFLSYILSYWFDSIISRLAMYFMILVIVCVVFEGYYIKKITGWLTLLIIGIVIDSIVVLLLMLILKQPVNVFMDYSVYRFIAILISKISLYYLVLWVTIKKNKLFDVQLKPSFVILLVFLFINVIVNMLSILNIYRTYDLRHDIINYLVFSFAITCVLVIAIYENILLQSKEQLELQLYKQQEDLQKKYLLAIESSTNEMKRIKHDFANHMMCVLGYLETKNYPKLEQYIHKLYMPLETTGDIIVAGHPVISSMVYSKMLSAKKNKTLIKVESNFEDTVHIDDIDLCILIGNVLDNAIEACVHVDEDKRNIRLCVQTKKQWFLLDCKNPINEHLLVKHKDTFITNKKDKSMHGIGLKNIQSIVNKYGGDVTIDLQDQQFEIRISINNKMNN